MYKRQVPQERQPHVEDKNNGQTSNEQQEEERPGQTHMSTGQSTATSAVWQQTSAVNQGQLNNPSTGQEDNAQPQVNTPMLTSTKKQMTHARPGVLQQQEQSQQTPHEDQPLEERYQ